MCVKLLSVTLAILTATSIGADASSRLCGRQLADALDLVCMGTGFHWDVNKRTGLPQLSKRGYWRSKRSVRPRGVVEECCDNVCSLDTLEMYCAEPASSTRLSVLRQRFGAQATSPGHVMSTTPSPPPLVANPSTPSSQLAANPRKFNSFFYLHVGPRPTRSPLI